MTDKILQTNGPGRPKDQAKRQAILDAAQSLFLSNGYDGSSMDAIAAEAGVSKLTVYNHFTDKETLFSAAVAAKCTSQLPEGLFELTSDVSIEKVLMNIGRAFHTLINSRESIELHRVMVSLSTQESKLPEMFFQAGPQTLIDKMTRLLTQANSSGTLKVETPQLAADQFFCLLKGTSNFALLIGCRSAHSPQEAELHVSDCVKMFIRAYQP